MGSFGLTSAPRPCWLSGFTEVGQEGGKKRKEACGFVTLMSPPPPPVSGMEASSKKRMKAELLTFGKGPLASD